MIIENENRAKVMLQIFEMLKKETYLDEDIEYNLALFSKDFKTDKNTESDNEKIKGLPIYNFMNFSPHYMLAPGKFRSNVKHKKDGILIVIIDAALSYIIIEAIKKKPVEASLAAYTEQNSGANTDKTDATKFKFSGYTAMYFQRNTEFCCLFLTYIDISATKSVKGVDAKSGGQISTTF